MPRDISLITLFVASPSDVQEERDKVAEVVEELNYVFKDTYGVMIDVVRYETNAYPAFGEDAQAVINEQVGSDWDIFVGILWHRFGTPRNRAESGTLEEFQTAKRRFDQDRSSCHLMVYFKQAPVPPHSIQPDQLAKVQEFRSSLGKEGGLYWPYSDVSEFEKHLRMHLNSVMRDRKKSRNVSGSGMQVALPQPSSAEAAASVDEAIFEDDEGILDLQDRAEEGLNKLSGIMDSISSAITKARVSAEKGVTDLNRLRQPDDKPPRKEIKRIINLIASDMNGCSARIDAETPLFRSASEEGFGAFTKSLQMLPSPLQEGDINALSNLKDIIDTTVGNIGGTYESSISLGAAITNLPRMTTDLNRAKRRLSGSISDLCEEYLKSQRLAQAASATIAEILKQSHINP